MLKQILLILSAISINQQSDNNVTLQDIIRAELSIVTYKFLSGVILSFLIIFSIYEFEQGLKTLFDKLEDGSSWHILSFGSLSIVGLFLMFLLFRNPSRKMNKSKEDSPLVIDFQLMGIQFIQGVLEGYNLQDQKENSGKKD